MKPTEVMAVVLGLIALVASFAELGESTKTVLGFCLGAIFVVPMLAIEAGLLPDLVLGWFNVILESLAVILAVLGFYRIAPTAVHGAATAVRRAQSR